MSQSFPLLLLSPEISLVLQRGSSLGRTAIWSFITQKEKEERKTRLGLRIGGKFAGEIVQVLRKGVRQHTKEAFF